MIVFTLESNPLLFPLLFLIALLTFSIGEFVLLKARKGDVSQVFFWLCFFCGLWGLSFALVTSNINSIITIMAAYGTELSALPIPLLFFLLCSCFPDKKIPYNRIQIWLLSIPTFLLLASFFTKELISISVLANGRLFVKLGFFTYPYLLNILIYFLAGVSIVIFNYLRSTSEYEKARYRYFFLGLLLTAVTSYGMSAFLLLFGIKNYIYLGPIGIVFLIVFTSFSILKYRLMDITLIIKKTTAYSIVTSLITFAYVIVVMAFEVLFRSYWGQFTFWAAIPAALVIAITFTPLRDRLQKMTDQIFFKQTIEYQKVIKEVSHLISSVTDLNTLFRLIDRTIIRVMCIKSVAVLLLEERENSFRVEKTNGHPAEFLSRKLNIDSSLAAYLNEKKDAIILDEVKSLLNNTTLNYDEREKLNNVCRELEYFGAVAAIPSFTRDKLVGILCLGEKLSGEAYSPDDLDMMLTLASEAGVAIENAKLYRDIRETRDYLNNLIEGSNDAIITMDLNGKAISWNKGAENIFGYGPAEVIGKTPPVLSDVMTHELINKVLNKQEIKAMEIQLKNKNGIDLPALLTISPIVTPSGHTAGFSAIIKDITELRKVDKLKQDLLSLVSHELSAPLTPIKNSLSLLLSDQLGKLTTQQKEALSIAASQSDHLHLLIDSLIDISRMEAGRPLELQKEPVSINEIIKTCFESYKQSFEAKGINAKANYSPMNTSLMGDKNKLTQAIDNLLGNAVKFSPRGGDISITINKEEGAIKVSISDMGIGIAAEYLEKIFDKFYQIDSDYTRSLGGIGMGLTITREIINAHGGKIWAESKGIGKGSDFAFILPVS